MEYDESMLLQIPNLGKGTAKEIMQKLENMDFPIEGAELVKKEPPFRLDSEYKESILEKSLRLSMNTLLRMKRQSEHSTTGI